MSIAVEIDLDEFCDDDILQAVNDRGLTDRIIAGVNKAKATAIDGAYADMLRDAIQHVMGHRIDKARDCIEAAIAICLPPYLFDAREAIARGQYSAAICALDAAMTPSPAATATTRDVARACQPKTWITP